MPYDIFMQSTLSNLLLIFAYLGYKFLARVASSKCHYTREHGLELHLPDADEDVDVGEIN